LSPSTAAVPSGTVWFPARTRSRPGPAGHRRVGTDLSITPGARVSRPGKALALPWPPGQERSGQLLTIRAIKPDQNPPGAAAALIRTTRARAGPVAAARGRDAMAVCPDRSNCTVLTGGDGGKLSVSAGCLDQAPDVVVPAAGGPRLGPGTAGGDAGHGRAGIPAWPFTGPGSVTMGRQQQHSRCRRQLRHGRPVRHRYRRPRVLAHSAAGHHHR